MCIRNEMIVISYFLEVLLDALYNHGKNYDHKISICSSINDLTKKVMMDI